MAGLKVEALETGSEEARSLQLSEAGAAEGPDGELTRELRLGDVGDIMGTGWSRGWMSRVFGGLQSHQPCKKTPSFLRSTVSSSLPKGLIATVPTSRDKRTAG